MAVSTPSFSHRGVNSVSCLSQLSADLAATPIRSTRNHDDFMHFTPEVRAQQLQRAQPDAAIAACCPKPE
jgi:hypothetical protein